MTDGWQDISTAPRDQEVLLWVDLAIGPPLVIQGRWYNVGADEHGWCDVHGNDYPVSHWMPLPAPPKEQA